MLIASWHFRRDGVDRLVEPIDPGQFANFRLVTARRNPNMVILLASLIVGVPWIGIQLVALWTLISLIVHAVQLAQANDRARRGKPVVSWLDA